MHGTLCFGGPYSLWEGVKVAYCRNCGHDVGSGAKFCPECGAAQTSSGEPSGTQTPDRARTGEAGAVAPLIELGTHWFMTGRPARISVYESGVELVRSDPLRKESQFMRYDQIAQVAVRRGLLFSTLVIESRGGGAIVVESLPKHETDRAARLIDQRSK